MIPGPGELERFRAIVARRLGLHMDDGKLGPLADVLRRRLEANGRSPGAYLDSLGTEPWREELGAVARELTVSETYFFRHLDQFRAFAEVALPERIRAPALPNRLRILSAGCASGEEPYSLAIFARETVNDPVVGGFGPRGGRQLDSSRKGDSRSLLALGAPGDAARGAAPMVSPRRSRLRPRRNHSELGEIRRAEPRGE